MEKIVNPPESWGAQYLDTGWMNHLFTLVLVFFILFNIFRAKKGKNLFIRRIAGLNAIDEAIGRAAEMGKPVLMVPGLGDLNAISVQALNIFAHVTRTAARFANPIRVCCGNAAVFTVAQEIIRDTYQQEGALERYDPDSVRFVSDRQFAFAAGVSGMILREQTAATFFLGEFFAESLIFAETANSIGAIQVASSTESTQTPFFIAACDYVLIGDEFYAASAYLTRQPVLVGSLVGQDYAKLLVMATIIIGVLTTTFQMGLGHQNMLQMEKEAGRLVPASHNVTGPVGSTIDSFTATDTGEVVPTPVTVTTEGQMVPVLGRAVAKGDTAISKLFNSQGEDMIKERIKIDRESEPKPTAPGSPAGGGQ